MSTSDRQRFRQYVPVIAVAIEFISALLTVLLAIIFAWVNFLFQYGSEIEAVRWDAHAVMTPLSLAGNWLIPMGVVFHVLVVTQSVIRRKRILTSLAVVGMYACASLGIWISAKYFCTLHLEGRFFDSVFWWIAN